MTGRIAGLLAAMGGLLLSACEHGTDFRGTVVAPVSVQQLFSAEQPGQLLVVATLPDDTGLSDDESVFCMPSQQERRIDARAFSFGCAPAGTVRVSAFAVRRSAAQVDCGGPGRLLERQALNREDALASGSVDVPMSRSGVGACQDGHIAFDITLEPVAR